ncbi:macrophage mannose receptor 1-like [Lissotriton helveticus]
MASWVLILSCSMGLCLTITETGHVLVKAKKSFQQANDYCRNALHGNLMTIRSDTEHALAVSVSEGNEVWIGLYTITFNDWKWTSGTRLSYTNWASKEEKTFLSCGTLKSGPWHSKNCWDNYYFICSTDAAAPAATAQSSSSDIASSYLEVNNTSSYPSNDSLFIAGPTNDSLSSLFEALNGISFGNPYGLGTNSTNTGPCTSYTLHLILERMTWNEARNHCVAEHTDLASIPVVEVQWALSKLLIYPDTASGVWIGLHRNRLYGYWYWVNQAVFDFSFWGEKKPSTPLSENCGMVSREPGRNFTWQDECCRVKLPFICFSASQYNGAK